MSTNYNVSPQWWDDLIESKDRHERITQLVDTLKHEQSYVDRDNLEHLRLYIKRNYKSDADGSVLPAGSDPRIGVNVVKSAIDTVSARICLQKPRPMFLTQGGRWKQRLRAKKLQKFVEGVFYESDFYSKARRAFKDCGIFGTGFLKFYEDGGKLTCDRVFPGEVLVDESAAMNGMPRSMFQTISVPVENLVAEYPEYKDQILTSKIFLHCTATGRTTHMVRAIEAWHLPDCKGKNGRHTLCVDGATLFDGEWKHDFFPFVALRWNELPVGYYGNGAAEDLAGLQNELSYIFDRMRRGLHGNTGVYLLKHASDKTPNSHFTNSPEATIIEWSGEHAPQLVTNQAINQQVIEIAKWYYGLSFEDVGVSQMSATSKKPAGIESGIALQTLMDVESQRHGLIQANWEDFVVRCSKVLVALAKDCYKGSTKKVLWDSGRFVETIEWSEVNMDEDEYILKIWPTNLLPATPAGRLDTVEKMLQSGMIDAHTGMMFLDFPDVEFAQDTALAALKNILWIVDQVIYEDNYVAPRQFQDLARGMQQMQLGLARAQTEGAPESVLERGLQWIAEANDLMPPPPPPPTLGLPPDQMAAMGMPPDPMMGGMPMDPMAGGAPPMDPSMMPPPGAVPPAF